MACAIGAAFLLLAGIALAGPSSAAPAYVISSKAGVIAPWAKTGTAVEPAITAPRPVVALPKQPVAQAPATKPAPPANGKEICGQFESTMVSGGQYMVQNNAWGAGEGDQCTMAFDGGLVVTKANHNKPDGVAAYPNLMSGCWMGTCTEGTKLPLAVSSLGPIMSSIQTTTVDEGKYNVAYDIWLDPTPRTNEQNTGAELMIWLKEVGGVAPIGSVSDTVTIGGVEYDVWTGTNGEVPVISWVRKQYSDSAMNLPITDFVKDALQRGVVEQNWYLTNIQAGFEPWVGGQSLTVNSFSVTY